MLPKYPIYIPSKGRADTSLTAKLLRSMHVPFKVVVEPVEYETYARALGEDVLLALPFSNLGQGSIPARNWIWEHALAAGAKRHWCIDDNVRYFYRLHLNRRLPVRTGTLLACAEEFTDRYENVALSGLNNIAWAPDREPSIAPFRLNTRIYSIILLNTALPYRWRGRYNEDTDLALRVLKDGYCTIQFNAFLADKVGTLTMRGGNTDTIYNTGDYRREFAESLQRQHPDVVKVAWKFGRWHHQVDYSPFKRNRLRLKPGITPTGTTDEHGLVLRRRAKLPESASAPPEQFDVGPYEPLPMTGPQWTRDAYVDV